MRVRRTHDTGTCTQLPNSKRSMERSTHRIEVLRQGTTNRRSAQVNPGSKQERLKRNSTHASKVQKHLLSNDEARNKHKDNNSKKETK